MISSPSLVRISGRRGLWVSGDRRKGTKSRLIGLCTSKRLAHPTFGMHPKVLPSTDQWIVQAGALVSQRSSPPDVLVGTTARRRNSNRATPHSNPSTLHGLAA